MYTVPKQLFRVATYLCLLNSQIREETNTKIDLPAENSNSEMIIITGKKANCELARNRILAIQKELVRCVFSASVSSIRMS